MIEGITLTSLRVIPGMQGDVLHAIKASSPCFSVFGEAYFSCVKYKEIKGWKKHKRMTMNLVVPSGRVEFFISDGFNLHSVVLSRSNYQRLTIKPCLWVAFRGLSLSESIILNIADMEHDPDECVVKDIDKLGFCLDSVKANPIS